MKYHFYKHRNEQTKDGDADALLAYLWGNKEVDPTYFFIYIKDEVGRLENFFWCDKQLCIDYKTFGHILAFDITYKCNAYNKLLVPIVGISHNRKIMVFVCAKVVHEKESSFIWVLEQVVKVEDRQK